MIMPSRTDNCSQSASSLSGSQISPVLLSVNSLSGPQPPFLSVSVLSGLSFANSLSGSQTPPTLLSANSLSGRQFSSSTSSANPLFGENSPRGSLSTQAGTSENKPNKKICLKGKTLLRRSYTSTHMAADLLFLMAYEFPGASLQLFS